MSGSRSLVDQSGTNPTVASHDRATSSIRFAVGDPPVHVAQFGRRQQPRQPLAGGLGLVIAAMILAVILSAALAVDSLTSDPETAKALWLVKQGGWTLMSPALATFGLGISVGAIRHGDLTAEAAAAYHGPQLRSLAEAGADFASVLTMTHAEEAVGVAQAAKDAGIAVTVSFTVETDGALPSGQSLQEAIEAVDAATDGYPDRYGIKCAHPEHFAERLSAGEGWCHRIGLVQANASKMSHEELDDAPDLDAGDPTELGLDVAGLRQRLPRSP